MFSIKIKITHLISQILKVYLRGMTLEEEHNESRGLGSDLLEEILEPVTHEGDVLLGLVLVGATEWTASGQEQVGQRSQRPDVALREYGLIVDHLGRLEVQRSAGSNLHAQLVDLLGRSKVHQFHLDGAD